MTPAVVVKALSKRFRRVGGGRLRAMIDSAIGRCAGCLWAVRDVSFEVARGEVLGIIGPNGAGKSTLLKMLAGILRPTSGQVEHLGRLSALIELGAGFHPDLTGRENVRLNGAILGVSQRAIVARMDEIAEFAGLRDSMHMPVKHFSSGMTARLGFSIAAHVDPEILLVDEVLSVGDRVFRARCLDRMNSLLRRGATVVFVSHDLRTVCSFCDRVMLLDRGRAVFTGSAGRAVTEYQRLSDVRPVREVSGEADLVVEGMRLVDAHGVERGEAAGGEGFALEAEVSVRRAVPAPGLAIQVIRRWDELMVGRVAIPVSDETRIHLRARMRAHLLPGEYEFRIEATSGGLPVRVASRGRPAWLLVTGATVAGGVAELGPQISFSLAGAATHHHE